VFDGAYVHTVDSIQTQHFESWTINAIRRILRQVYSQFFNVYEYVYTFKV